MTPGPSCWHIVDDGVYGISLSGVRQSPINIETAGSVVETDDSLDELKYEYVPENCTQVGNTGASWKVDVNPEGSSINIVMRTLVSFSPVRCSRSDRGTAGRRRLPAGPVPRPLGRRERPGQRTHGGREVLLCGAPLGPLQHQVRGPGRRRRQA